MTGQARWPIIIEMDRRALRKKLNFPTPAEEKLLWNLHRYGAPLSRKGKPGLVLSVEEALARALALARRFPFVAMVWPVLFARNADQVNWDSLERYARGFREGDTLGFYMALMRSLTGKPTFADLESRLVDTRRPKPENFFRVQYGPMMQELAHRRTPEEARRWNFLMATRLEDFRETWVTFVK